MRVKRSINHKDNSTNANPVAQDLDPIMNDKLHRDIWSALQTKISHQTTA